MGKLLEQVYMSETIAQTLVESLSTDLNRWNRERQETGDDARSESRDAKRFPPTREHDRWPASAERMQAALLRCMDALVCRPRLPMSSRSRLSPPSAR
jgi:hypothetical protein